MNGWHLQQRTPPTITGLRVILLGLTTGLVPLAAVAGFLGPEMADGGNHGMDVLAHVAIALIVAAIPSALSLRTAASRRGATRHSSSSTPVGCRRS